MPPEASQEIAKAGGISDADWEQTRQSLISEMIGQLEQQGGFRNIHTLDSGIATLSGHRTVWVEYTAQTDRVGIEINLHNVSFIVLDGGRLLSINLTSGSGAQSKLTADDEFKRNGRLFQLILNSLVVQDDPAVADVR